jgi:hypothetical protein
MLLNFFFIKEIKMTMTKVLKSAIFFLTFFIAIAHLVFFNQKSNIGNKFKRERLKITKIKQCKIYHLN